MKLRSRRVVVPAALVLVVLMLAAVLLYPGWSGRQGKHARWVIEHGANELRDYDADRLLVVGGTNHAVLDRATGATRLSWFGTVESRAALVPGGVVTSDVSTLSLSRDGDGTVWEKAGGTEQYTLVAVRDEVVVAAVKLADGYTLTGFALADGTQVWTMSNLVRVGFVKQGTEPARPPGALRTTRLIPVVRANAPGWSLVDAGSGAVVATTPAGVVPVAAGQLACPRLRNAAPTWRCSARTSRSPGWHRPAATARRCGRSTGAGFW